MKFGDLRHLFFYLEEGTNFMTSYMLLYDTYDLHIRANVGEYYPESQHLDFHGEKQANSWHLPNTRVLCVFLPRR
jgi:hypothetical protein